MGKEQNPFRIHVLTLFPDIFPGVLGQSVTGRALAANLWQLDVTDIRDFATDKHNTVDDTPYGGGAGMVMRADVVGAAIEHAKHNLPHAPVVFLTPTGAPFKQKIANTLAGEDGLILLCGRYEGVDQRVLDTLVDREISLGDFVLTGGELAALPILDAVLRQVPGVLGNDETLAEESFADSLAGQLEYPHYTRPEVWRGRQVPAVLKSGNHGAIHTWRHQQAKQRTERQRPDLVADNAHIKNSDK